MRRSSTATRATAAALLLAAVVPAAAVARTDVSYDAGTGLKITATTRESLLITGRFDQGVPEFVIQTQTSPLNPLVPGTGCRILPSGSGQFVFCTAMGSRRVNADMSEEQDSVRIFDLFAGDAVLRGNGGNDTLIGGRGNDQLFGGDGGDTLADRAGGTELMDGGPGDDGLLARDFTTFFSDAPNGADVYRGGTGTDMVAYGGSGQGTPPPGVTVTLDNLANDGNAGENDNIGPAGDVEGVAGSVGDDTIIGNALPNRLSGGVGNDVLIGGSPAVLLISSSIFSLNRDAFSSFATIRPVDDTLVGGNGTDRLSGQGGNDDLDGGLGTDDFDGGVGDDKLLTRDGESELRIACGAGQDLADIDLRDPSPADGLACETVRREAVKEKPVVRIGARTRRLIGRTFDVALRCLKTNDRNCSGRLSAALLVGGERNPAPTRYVIRRGATERVVVRLAESEARALRRRGRAAVVIVSVEKGRLGTKTVQRVIGVRSG